MSLFWLSFVDPARPEGSKFVGGCLVRILATGDELADMKAAAQEAWRLGCNPGGEVMVVPPPPNFPDAEVDPKWIGRLLTKAECEACDAMLGKLYWARRRLGLKTAERVRRTPRR